MIRTGIIFLDKVSIVVDIAWIITCHRDTNQKTDVTLGCMQPYNSKIDYTVQAGKRYIVLASGYDTLAGSFVLDVSSIGTA